MGSGRGWRVFGANRRWEAFLRKANLSDQPRIIRQAIAQSVGEREHPLPDGRLGENAIDEMRRGNSSSLFFHLPEHLSQRVLRAEVDRRISEF